MSPEFTLPGHKLFYLDQNPDAKEAVILLHGLGANSGSWLFQIPDLMDADFRVLAPDTRSFGQSTYPGHTSVEEMAEDVTGLVQRVGIESLHVVGISMGGAIALQLTLDQPNLVNRLVLVNTFASLRPKNVGVWFYFMQRLILVHTVGLEKQADFVSKRLFPRSDQEFLRQQLCSQISQADPAGYRATMRALARFDVTAQLSQIRSSTLVITGDLDTTVPVDVQTRLVNGIPSARHSVIRGAGHAVSVEKPKEFNRILLDFLTQEPDSK